MNRRLLLTSGLAMIAACGGRRLRRIQAAEEGAAQVVAEIRARKVPYALSARFGIKVVGPNFSGSTKGAMLLLNPASVRLEIMGPVGTPLFIAASDGKALHAWTQKQNTFYRGDDALAVLGELTGGAVAVSDLIAMLTAQLPLPDAQILETGAEEDGLVKVVLQAPHDMQLHAAVELRNHLMRRMQLSHLVEGAAPEELIRVSYPDLMFFGSGKMPEQMAIDLPTIGWRAEIEVHTWEELGVIPDAFSLAPPSGASERDLVEALKAMAAEREAAP